MPPRILLYGVTRESVMIIVPPTPNANEGTPKNKNDYPRYLNGLWGVKVNSDRAYEVKKETPVLIINAFIVGFKKPTAKIMGD